MLFLSIFIGAGLGGLARYGMGRLIPRAHPGDFPLATFLVNAIGCLLIGLLVTLLGRSATVPEWVRGGLVVGVLGGFTTFSSFGRETFDLVIIGRPGVAVAYVLLSNAVGLLLVWVGHAAAGPILSSTGR